MIELALYDRNDGFYASGGRAGRRGDFVTSPEVGPLFGAVLANALDRWWVDLGEPDPYVVVEHGAGPGTLARTIIRADPACAAALHYTMVEVSAAQRDLHPEGPSLRSLHAPRSRPAPHVVLANELLDNLPFGIAQHDGTVWRECLVDVRGDAFVEVLGDRVDVAGVAGDAGDRAPLQHRAHAWVQAALASVESGVVCVFDYTVSADELPARGAGWLRTYRGQERGGEVLETLGQQDITTDVVLDQLPDPTVVETQSEFLGRFGIEGLVDEGRRLWEAHAAAPDLAAVAGRSRVGEAAALCDPSGLGGFTALVWRK